MRIAAVGDNCMDVYEKEGAVYPGGNPVNVAVYLTRLGEHASYTGVVGNDRYGEIMIESLRDKGVDVSHLRTVPGDTAITRVELVDGERVFGEYTEGVLADFTLSAEDIDFLCAHDLVVTGIWGNIERDVAAIAARGVPVVFDFSNQPGHPIVESTVADVTYAFFSFDEADNPRLRRYLADMQARGPRCVVATLGEHGSLAFDGAQFHTCGIVPCEVVDTMGAGDSFIAGFIQGILLGEEIPACMRRGAACSSVTIAYRGAW